MKIRSLLNCIIMGAMVFMSGCICKPILYEPKHDPSPLILSLKIPQSIETLSGIPRDRTMVENGIILATGSRQTYGVKEAIIIKKGAEYAPSVTYVFTLYYSVLHAKKDFELFKNDRFIKPFFFGEAEEHAYYITYILQDQGRNGFFCETSPYFHSHAGFRLRNLFIEIRVIDEENKFDSLTRAVEYIADILAKEWSAGA
jgi:hypothetical protein